MSHRLSRRPSLASAPGLLLAACALVTGCTLPSASTAPPAPPPPPAPAPVASPAPAAAPAIRPVEAEPQAPATQMQPRAAGPLASMLSHADRVRGLSAADLSAEVARLNEAATAAPTDPTLQMQQALALAQTRNTPDLVRALGLVQRVAADNSDTGRALQPLARLLVTRLQEQRRAEDERDRQGQQLRDAQRRIDQLNDRLEALRAIERSFGRPAPTNGSTPRTAP